MIALIGAHGTGKTTLTRAFALKHPEITISDGSSRPMKEIAKTLGLSKQQYQEANNIFAIHRHKQNIWQKNYFTTRTLIDNYIYCRLAGWYSMAFKVKDVFFQSKIEKIKYFYLPIEFDIEDDGVRFTDPEFQKAFDEEIHMIVKYYNLKMVKLTGSIEDRIKQLEKHLGYD